MQVQNDSTLSDIKSVELGTTSLHIKYESVSSSYSKYSRVIKHHCPDQAYIRQALFIAKAIIEHTYVKEAREENFENLYSEISNEFGIYI